MDFRYLGRSGLKISEITYGNWLTHGSQVENDVATQCVRAALDAAGTNPYWGEIEHYHNFTRPRLNALLEAHGFSPIDYNISERYRSCMEVIAART
jgi:hypothetical protein